MATMWNDSLRIGIDQIDQQHKELFLQADKLFENGKKGSAKEYIGPMLQYLDAYTRKHFADEEKLMREVRYPGYEEQRKMHAGFIAKITQLRKEYETSGGNILVILNANQIVIDWLVQHISKEDKKIGEFITSKK